MSTLVVVLLACSLGATPAAAARKKYLKLQGTVAIPSLNAKVKLFKDVKSAPPGSLERLKLTRTSGNEKSVFEIYSIKDIWRRDNLLGVWKNDLCDIAFYRFNLPIPQKVPTIYKKDGKSFVLREAYDKWKAGLSQDGLKLSDEEMAAWLSYVLDLEVGATPETIKKNAPKKATTKRFSIEGTSGENGFIYVVSTIYEPDKPFVVFYNVKGGDHDRDVKAISGSLASFAFVQPKKNAKTATKERTLTRKTEKKERSAQYIASRDMVINSIKNMKNWWYFETTNFLMVANIKNKKTARELADNLEKCRSVFERLYPPAKPFDAVSVARMFKTRDGYVSYLGKEYEWTGGIWMPSKKELVISPMDWGSRAERRKMMIDTTFHESFHMYIYFACGEKQTAVWFNEGNATFLEGLEFRAGKVRINPTHRIETAKKAALHADIPKLLAMSYKEFYGSNKKENYALGWGLMYFLWKGAPVLKHKNNYSEIPVKYYQAMLDTGSGEKATKIAWEGIDMDRFSADFREFWATESLIKKAERYNPLVLSKKTK